MIPPGRFPGEGPRWPTRPGGAEGDMMEQHELHLTLNGASRVLPCEPDAPLLDVLRHGAGLSGPRFGCGLGLCGACFVLIDGQARSSCDLPAWAAEGRPVTTLEGLMDGETLDAVQRAFIDEQAAQCGYCTNGMIMAAKALLLRTPNPTLEQIKQGLAGNLCRCGTHTRILSAVMRASRASEV
jgi:nicotinate dehydrogenase subunit A